MGNRFNNSENNERTARRNNHAGNFNDEGVNENIIEGRNPVIELLKTERTIEKLFVASGEIDGSIKKILAMAREKKVTISEVDKRKLDEMSYTKSHQGVIAIAAQYKYYTVDEILETAKEKNEDPFIIVLDEIEDPHNLGSIIRTANVCGAHGVIISKRRSAYLSPIVGKTSAGAVEHTKVAKVTNINQTLEELKDKGLWVIGTDMGGDTCYKSNLKGPIAIVIGNEGKGIARLTREKCDSIVSIPVKGEIQSLNASVAAGIVMYEIVRQRS